MPIDPELDRRLTEALTEILRDHLPNVSGAGRVEELVLGVTWLDESPAAGTYVFYNATALGAYGLLKSSEKVLIQQMDKEGRNATWDSEDDSDDPAKE